MAALARVERTDFLSPMCIGEVATVSAEITYTSRRSVEVQVNVLSENILTGNAHVCRRCAKPTLLMGRCVRAWGACLHRVSGSFLLGNRSVPSLFLELPLVWMRFLGGPMW